MYTPVFICLLLLGVNFKDVALYTLLAIVLGSILLFFKELSFTIFPIKKTPGLIKSMILGLSVGLSVVILESIIKSGNNQVVQFYYSFLSTNLTTSIPFLLIVFIPVILFKNRIFIFDEIKGKLNSKVKHSQIKKAILSKRRTD